MDEKPLTRKDLGELKRHIDKRVGNLKYVRQEDLDQLRTERADDMEKIDKGMKKLADILEPIAQTYASASLVGKWIMAVAVFVSVVLGIIYTGLKLKGQW